MLQTLFPSKAGKEKLDKLEAFEKLKTNKETIILISRKSAIRVFLRKITFIFDQT